MPVVSIIIPVYRDAEALTRTLAAIDCAGADVIVVCADGDESCAMLRQTRRDVRWISAPRGRARQMNAGAAAARGSAFVFLHADTILPSSWRATVDRALPDRRVTIGCFRFSLDSRSWRARVIEVGVWLRVAILRLPYGDQALFMRREDFEAVGGYTELPIMEDVDLVRKLLRRGRLHRSAAAAITSARRWEEDGWLRRTAHHLSLITRYFAGIHPDRLV
jgi:rSAM/selenodomain-associated transferase 2